MDSLHVTESNSGSIANLVELRDIVESDLDFFFKHQLDQEAGQLIGFTPRNRVDFDAHWAKVLSDQNNLNQTIIASGEVAGNIVCFIQAGEREVGYCLGREYWGNGIATKALTMFLLKVPEGPLFAHVAKHNYASFRVLEKCGFVVVGEDRMLSEVTNEVIEEWMMKLD